METSPTLSHSQCRNVGFPAPWGDLVQGAVPCKEAGQHPREQVAPEATPRQEPTSESPSPHSSKVVSQPQTCQVDNPPWLESVMCPVLDFPETNLLDDLSLVRHQCPPINLGMQNNPFLQKNPGFCNRLWDTKSSSIQSPFSLTNL